MKKTNSVLSEAIAYAQSRGEKARFYTNSEEITYKNGHRCLLHETRPTGWVVAWPNGDYTKDEKPSDFKRGWAK